MNRFVASNVALACLFVFCAPVIAQEAPASGAPGTETRRERPARAARGAAVTAVPAEVLAQELKLTEGQKDQVSKIQEKLASDVKALRPKGVALDTSARDKIRDLNQQASKDILALLTADQKKKLPAVLREMGGLRMAGIPLRALGELKLTADQKKQIAGYVKDAQAGLKDLSAADRRVKMRDAMKDVASKTQAILTADQKKVLEGYQKKQGRRGTRA